MAMLPWCDGTIRYRVIAPSKMVFEENGGRITLLLSIVIMTLIIYADMRITTSEWITTYDEKECIL